MTHEHHPNPAGDACRTCGLRATRVSPEELARHLTRELRRVAQPTLNRRSLS